MSKLRFSHLADFGARPSLPSRETIAQTIAYDPQTGVLTRISAPRGNKRLEGKEAGFLTDNGYRAICINTRTYHAHVLAWVLMTGEWPTQQVDHRNRNRSDNRWENLRLATRQEQQWNSDRRAGKSGHRGVTLDKRRMKWVVRFSVGGRRKEFGRFAELSDAVAVYTALATRFHGNFYVEGLRPSHPMVRP